ncbi:MAG: ATPase [Firmicutes bacterium]|nr:ATPase [Bacillota bacterium]
MAVDRQVEIEDLLSSIDEILEQAKAVPFSDKVMVERAEILEITKEIRLRLPTEIEQSKWVLEEKNRILADAQKEADAKIAAAEEERSNMVNEHEVTKRAYAQAEEIVEASKKVARDMKIGAKEYADDLLQQVDEQMKRMSDFTVGSIENILKEYQGNIQNFNGAMDQKRQILQQNRKELNVNRSN